jgi:flagellar hook-associated protein 3 FlgL
MGIQIRSTQQSIAARVTTGLQANLQRLGRLQEQLSSGKQISRPSDSPVKTVSALQLRGKVRAEQQYQRNGDDGLGWLGTADTTLTSAALQVRRVRDLVLQGLSSGSASADGAKEAMAVEIENIRKSLIGLSNTTYMDRPVFGGTTGLATAYDAAGGYQGDAGPVERSVGEGAKVRVDITGPDVFGSGATSLFGVLDSISANLRSGGDLAPDLVNLDAGFGRIQTSVADVGARYNRISTARQTSEDRLLMLKAQLSDVEDIDLPSTIMDMQLQQVAYQAALAATSRVIQPSLVDFLR